MSDSCRVEVAGLTLSVMPHFSSSPGDDLSEEHLLCMYMLDRTTHCHCHVYMCTSYGTHDVFVSSSNDD